MERGQIVRSASAAVSKRVAAMTWAISRARLLVCVGLAHLSIQPAVAQLTTINSNAAWCWFQDERAIVDNNKFIIGSITRAGDIQVTQFDPSTNKSTTTVLHEALEADDHNAPAFIVRPDGRYIAIYSKHSTEYKMYYRISVRSGDASAWEAEHTINDTFAGWGYCYANPFMLTAENSKMYLFFRGIDNNPSYCTSVDHGVSWSKPRKLISIANQRPYVKYCSNGVDRIDFAYTDGHPQEITNSTLYHCYYRNGSLYKTDGTLIRELDGVPITPKQGSQVYDGSSSQGECWVWDLHSDSEGKPVIAFTSFPSTTDHRYRYAKWTGSAWAHHEVARAGGYLYKNQPNYSGGIAINPNNTNEVFISSNQNVGTVANTSGKREILKGVTSDGGSTWKWQAVTSGSSADNLRPIVPISGAVQTRVFWMTGTYTSYTDYATSVMSTGLQPTTVVQPRTSAHRKTGGAQRVVHAQLNGRLQSEKPWTPRGSKGSGRIVSPHSVPSER